MTEASSPGLHPVNSRHTKIQKYKSKSRPPEAKPHRLYTVKSRAIVEERLQEEIELLGYEFPEA